MHQNIYTNYRQGQVIDCFFCSFSIALGNGLDFSSKTKKARFLLGKRILVFSKVRMTHENAREISSENRGMNKGAKNVIITDIMN